MPTESYTVRVTKDYLVFCCAHFITYDGSECERLHGHNYRAAVELDGPLDSNFYVFDFIALKNCTKALVDELDHHMLVALHNPLMHVYDAAGRVTVRFKDREWSFPRADCVLLPIANTTAELLARYLAQRLLDELRARCHFVPTALRVEVEESFGQCATYEWRG